MPSRRSSTKRRRGRETADAAPDALLSLPPDAVDEILTRVGILDAVRTSALSRAWRRRWEALPSLDLCFPRLATPDVLGVVDYVLLRHLGRVRRFRADLDNNTYNAGRIHDWLCAVSRRGVETLDLTVGDGFPALPSSVFSCSRLTSLTLTGCAVPMLPVDFSGFPELKRLAFIHVQLQKYGEDQLEEIIGTSPLLEHLDLTDVCIGGTHVRKWVLKAPNLRHLKIQSEKFDGGVIDEKLTSLCSAEICLCFSGSLVPHLLFNRNRNLVKLLSTLVQATELTIGTCCIPSSAKMLEILPCTFYNLKSLKLYMHLSKQPPIVLTFSLLKSAPKLEKLKIEIFAEEEQEFEANGEFLNALWTHGMCANLQVVHMIGINWRPNEMSFIELILSKARLLHTLSISHGEKIVMSTEDALSELLRYKRASSEAQVLFQGKAEVL